MNEIKNGVVDKPKKPIRKWFFRIMLYLVLFIILLLILFKLPVVQTWAVDKINKRLSVQLETLVEIKGVDIDLFEGVVLEQLYVEQLEKKDTLIFVEEFSFSLRKSLLSVLRKELMLNELTLRNAKVYNNTEKDKEISGLTLLLNKLFPKSETIDDSDSKEASKPLLVNVNRINLKHLSYISKNENTQQDVLIQLNSGHLRINVLDFKDNYYGLEEIVLDGPHFQSIQNKHIVVDDEVVNEESSETPVSSVIDESPIQKPEYQVFDPFNGECFFASIDKIRITNGVVEIVNQEKETSDYFFESIDLSLDSLFLNSSPQFSFILNQLQLKEKEAFEIHDFKIGKFDINDRKLVLDDFIFKTNESNISNSINLKYYSLDDFIYNSDKIFGTVNINPSKIALKEIIHFLPDLIKEPVVGNNKDLNLYFDGALKGRMNNLNLRDFNLRLGEKLDFKGDFSLRNLFSEKEVLYNITIDNLNTSIAKLKSIVPNFSPPQNFEKLGRLNYKGRLDGYLRDFVSYGTLNTQLGRAVLDMHLDLSESVEEALYSGALEVENFDLKSWSGDDNFGNVSFTAQVKDGRGLVQSKAHAILAANIDHISYKSYPYENIVFNGALNESKIEGELSIHDDNVSFDFNGTFEKLEENQFMDFHLRIDKMNLFNLHLTKEEMAVSGQLDVDLSGSNIDDVIGSLSATHMTIRKGKEVFLFDTLSLDSRIVDGAKKRIDFYSDIVDFNLLGVYKLDELPLLAPYVTQKNYQRYFDIFGINKSNSPTNLEQKFSYKYHIKDTEKYFNLIGLKDIRIVNAKGNGNVDLDNELIDFQFKLPSFALNEYKADDIKISARIVKDVALFSIGVDSIYIKEKKIDPLRFTVKMMNDTLNWNLLAGHIADSIGVIDLGGKITPEGKGVNFSFQERLLELLGTNWSFSTGNKGFFAKKYLDVEEFTLSDGSRTIRIDDINNEGVKINLSNINLETFNRWINFPPMDFFGSVDITLSHDNIFNKGNAFVYIDIDDFKVNEDDYGVLSSTFSIPNGKPIVGNVNLTDGRLNLDADVFLDLKNDSLDVMAHGEKMRIDVFEHFIKSGISDVVGDVDVDAHIYGSLSDLKMDADGAVYDAGVKVDYLGTYYRIHDNKFTSTRYYLDLSEIELIDRNDNIAYVSGGFPHDFFGKMKVNADLVSDKFISLNTTKDDNPHYYGFGEGKLDVTFRGDFNNTDIVVDAITGPGTKLSMPVKNIQSGFDEGFIQFSEFNKSKEEGEIAKEDEKDEYKLKGLDLELNIAFTPDAIVSIVFDERLGDIVRGVGEGEIQIYSRRNGDFNMFGDYTIEDGEYKFTAFRGVISKPFIVKKGSRLRWTGDPLDADININAYYDGLRAPLDLYLEEYLATFENLKSEAQNKTEVGLNVNLQGSLFKPDITFDVDFPNLTGALKSFAISRTNSLKKNENLFNQQIASLIVSQRFLPKNGGVFSGENLTDSGISTISEFLTSQLSIMTTGLLEELLANSIWADIDFDVGVAKRTSLGTEENKTILPNEIEVHVKNKFKFWDERFSLDFGGNYFKDDFLNTGNLLIGDIEAEYFLNKKRNLKIGVYLKYDYEALSTQNRRTKLGTGLTYEYEFEDMIKKKKEEKVTDKNKIKQDTIKNK